jgi:prepilin-type N-terminal cleavage/methylation domain-containing protein
MPIRSPQSPARAQSFGFSLVEIAVVLVIIAILTTAIAVPLSSQIDQQRVNETTRQLEAIKEAIYGFAIANGRLPCPATDNLIYGNANSNGAELPVGGGACNVSVGYVPGATLGLTSVDANGFVVDSWGLTSNRVIYSVADNNLTGGSCVGTQMSPLTTSNGIRAATMDCVNSRPLLSVCSSTPTGAAGAATACPATATLTTSAPFVLVSRGKNAASTALGDEAHNVDGKLRAAQDRYFVSRLPSAPGAPGGEFDDIVTWGNLNTLFGRMVQASKLP